ncbi:MAG TPA: primosomal protein N' [Nitrospiraceae bacterium]
MEIPRAKACGSSPEVWYADVIVPRHLPGPFTYTIPALLRNSLRIGHRVLVPLGRSVVAGAVTAVRQTLPHDLNPDKLKAIRSLLSEGHTSEVSMKLLDLSRRLAEQYVAPWGQCLRLILPPAAEPDTTRRSRKVRPGNGSPFHFPLNGQWTSAAADEEMSSKDQDELLAILRCGAPEKVLLQAPVAARLRLVRKLTDVILEQKRTVLILTGEAERAEWMADFLTHSLQRPVACYHSGLPALVRHQLWEQVHHNVFQVVVGTRSAVFLPMQHLGLLWVEEEEDPALKEPQEPRYHACEVAWMRVQDERAVLMLGSSHASIETVEQTRREGRMLRMAPSTEAWPAIHVVDMREQKWTTMSHPLVQGIRDALERGAGAILFLNRKGYAHALICRDCGGVARCESCGVARTYYRQSACLICPYCRNSTSVPTLCPSCAGPRLSLVGEGTERIEEEARRLFPSIRILRIDGNAMKRKSQAVALWRKVQEKTWDLLIGTQLLFREGAVPAAGVVGVVQADAGLSVPDFRSSERTYHNLLDAVRLAQPASTGGVVVIQTYHPMHHAIRAVVEHDESRFAVEELSYRAALGYPPAVHLIVLHVSGPQESVVRDAATAWTARLRDDGLVEAGCPHPDDLRRLTLVGPAPAPVSRLRGRARWQILVKSTDRDTALRAIRWSVDEMERRYARRSAKFDVDVNPVEMW